MSSSIGLIFQLPIRLEGWAKLDNARLILHALGFFCLFVVILMLLFTC